MSACAVCQSRPAEVVLRVVFADAVDRSGWCMDCAADVVAQGYGEVERILVEPLGAGGTEEDAR